ncbi:two-component system response regulator CreB [Leeia sp.]|uniref:two-component system response regulator CreB n=1 Tax=Leeia sp. TaxID=2884678 RepID=UPI0035B23B7E
MKPSLLLLEDEAAIADSLIYALQTDGFAVQHTSLVRDALVAQRQQAFDLLILDIGLPDGNGFELCKQIRQHSDVPILFLSARNSEIDRVVGLEIGADDYVTKPFSPREVCARVKTILKRTRVRSAPPALFEHDAAAARIRYCGQWLLLTRFEYQLLATLLARPEQVFSRAQLMDQVWQDRTETLERTVDGHIKTLRAKLREVDAERDPIQTHRGLGYSLSLAG